MACVVSAGAYDYCVNFRKEFSLQRQGGFALRWRSEKEFVDMGRGRGWNTTSWISFRVALFIYIAGVTVWSALLYDLDNYGDKWPIYLTHWSILLESIYLATALAVACTFVARDIHNEQSAPESVRWLAKTMWFLRNAIGPASFTVFLLYWTLLASGNIDSVTAQVHGANWVIMILDFVFSAAPFRIVNAWCVYVYLFAYLIFSVLYFVGGGRDPDGSRSIYPVLNWGQPGITILVTAILSLTILPIAIVLQWSLHYYGRRLDPQIDSQPDTGLSDHAKLDEPLVSSPVTNSQTLQV